MTKISAEAQVLLYPQTAIPKKGPFDFHLVDRIGELLYPWSDSSGFDFLNALNPTPPIEWAAQPHFTRISGAMFVRFLQNGRVQFGVSRPEGDAFDGSQELSGFIITPRLALLDCKIGDTGGDLNTDATDLNWNILQGTWKTVLVPLAGQGTCLFNTGNDELAVASTAGNIPGNRSLCFEVAYLGHIPAGINPEQIISIGNKWALHLVHGKAPAICRYDGQTLEIFRVLGDGPSMNMQGGKYRIGFCRVAGRGVVFINEMAWWFLDTQEPLSNFAGGGITNLPKAKEVTWGAYPLLVMCFNVKARLGVRVIKWSSAGGSPYQAVVERSVPLRTALVADADPVVCHAGWEREGTAITITPGNDTNNVTWQGLLRASADGIDTPLLGTVCLRFAPNWSSPVITPVDLRPGTSSIRVSLPLPTVAPCATASLNLDREKLDKMAPGWRTVFAPYAPVTIRVRWQYQDGGAISYGNWRTVFKGYVYKPDKASEEVNDGAMTIFCMDESLRLKNPAAMLDERVPPLDVVFMERALAAGASNNGSLFNRVALYGAECVQEIVRHFKGDAEANAINGDGNPLRFSPANMAPLYSSESDFCGYAPIAAVLGESTTLAPVSQGGLCFPVPYGQDARAWISQFEQVDKAHCYYSRLPDSDEPVLIYGRLLNILSGRSVRRIPDGDYQSGDVDRLMTSLRTERRPDADINTINVWGKTPEGMEGFIPALRMARAGLINPNDVNNAIHSWERARIIRTPFALTFAEGMAQGIIAQLDGVRHEWPSVSYRGDENALPGDVLQFVMNSATSDEGLDLNGVRVRVESLDHDLRFGADNVGEFETTAYCRPLSTQERNALQNVDAT